MADQMLFDISQEILSCRVFPGDPSPQLTRLNCMDDGALYNLSSFSMCAHNGTHVDAPAHFFREGLTLDQLSLPHFVGDCFLARHEGEVTGEDALRILEKAREAGADRRILIAGDAVVTAEAAQVFAQAKLLLLGNESQTVGPPDAPMEVHLILLSAGMVLLEGVVLSGRKGSEEGSLEPVDLPEGKYFLNAAPLNLAGIEGAPCRAWLMTE